MTKGVLLEYSLSVPPLVLVFDFNPKSLTRTRTINLKTGTAPGTRGGYDFTLPTETPRVAVQRKLIQATSVDLVTYDIKDRQLIALLPHAQIGLE